jgi:hypothetical protein
LHVEAARDAARRIKLGSVGAGQRELRARRDALSGVA